MQNSRPTFKWSMTNDTYTAYILEVADSKSNTVWSSGIQHVPARDSNGFYSVEPDVYAGDILKVGTNYNWRVSMYNTKFYTNRTGVAWSDYTPFMVNTQTNGLDYGTIDVCARYFGPDAVRTNGIIRVEAFDTPDFTGKPVARTSLTLADNTAAGDTNTPRKVNASLIGLKPGTYYIRGYVDAITYKDGTKIVTNGVDRVLDSWEPWGYVANRGGTSKEVFRPLAVTISSSLGTCELFDLYIEDVDANGNGVPDAYEVQKNKGELYSNASISLNTYGLAVNSALTDSKLNTGSGTAAKLGTKGLLLSSSASGASATSLSSALALTLGNSDVAMLLLDTYSPSVTNKAEVTSIDISNISVVTTNTTPMVVIKSSETGTYSYTSASGSPSPFYAPAGDPGSMDVTVYLKYKNSLTDPSWTTAAELTVTVSEDSAVVTGVGPVTPPATVNYDSTTGETTVTITGGDASKCFYMITTEE